MRSVNDAEIRTKGDIEIGRVRVHGHELRFARSSGVGEPLLFCNGIGANLELMLPFVRAMSDRHVVVFDVPGAGESRPRWFWPRLGAYARYAVGVLDELGERGSFAVGGVSWGGALAQQIARNHHERVSRLVLMATGAGLLMVPGRPSALVRMLTPERYVSRTFMARHAETLYGGELRGRPDLAKTIAELIRAPSALTYFQQLTSIMQFSSAWWLHRVRCPALVMIGDDDPIVREVNGHVLGALLADARVHVVRGGGHLFVSLRPDETAAVVGQFLDEERAGGPAATA